jgi:hypothetical protein
LLDVIVALRRVLNGMGVLVPQPELELFEAVAVATKAETAAMNTGAGCMIADGTGAVVRR